MSELDSFDNLTTFFGSPVENFTGGTGLPKAQTHAYRVAVTWDDEDMEKTFMKRLDALLSSPDVGSLKALVIGSWGESMDPAASVMDKLLGHASKLTSLRALFFGDIAQEESEVSWIEQCDHGPLISALPSLEFYGVRGGNGLRFTGVTNGSLRKLVVQSGGLPSAGDSGHHWIEPARAAAPGALAWHRRIRFRRQPGHGEAADRRGRFPLPFPTLVCATRSSLTRSRRRLRGALASGPSQSSICPTER